MAPSEHSDGSGDGVGPLLLAWPPAAAVPAKGGPVCGAVVSSDKSSDPRTGRYGGLGVPASAVRMAEGGMAVAKSRTGAGEGAGQTGDDNTRHAAGLLDSPPVRGNVARHPRATVVWQGRKGHDVDSRQLVLGDWRDGSWT